VKSFIRTVLPRATAPGLEELAIDEA
jgi:hypothetical protein